MMKKEYVFLTIMIASFTLYSCNRDKKSTDSEIDYSKYVDPFIGTSAHGHTFPGAALPFGMVQVSPDNGKTGWDWSSGYHYSSDTIAGFSMTHLSGTGVGDLLDVCILPVTKKMETDTISKGNEFMRKYWSAFSHNQEIAHPGYYKVFLKSSDIWAEMTCSQRTGMFRFTFPESPLSTIILDLFHQYNYDSPTETYIKINNDNLITGYRFSEGWTPDQKVFFAIELSKSFYNVFLVDDQGIRYSGLDEIKGKGVRAAFEYATDEAETVIVKVGISSVSTENALINLRSEIPGWDFEYIKRKAAKTWNNELSAVSIKSDNQEKLKIFYTALYHALLAPNIYSDIDGEYRGPDDQVRIAKNFTHHSTFSLWDTFRGLHPLLTILKPNKVNDFVQSMMQHYYDFGLLPYWPLWGGETYCMIGYHSAPVLLDAYKKGLIKDISGKAIYEALKKSAMGGDSTKNFKDIELYIEYGYLPEDLMREKYFEGNPGHTESVSRTLEWAYDDWCVAQFAKEYGTSSEMDYFEKRAGSWKNLFDPSSGMMRPRNSDGSWVTPFDPLNTTSINGFTEGNSWQYSWFVPHDMDGLIEKMGGNDRFLQKLDSLFVLDSDPGEGAFVDVSGLIGQYAHGNEPCHHVAYLYNYAGSPYKTQYFTSLIADSLYTAKPDGLCGNEDCGQMSAWYILSTIGFYPVNPANGEFQIGQPGFEEITIRLPGRKTLDIITENFSEENKYVERVEFNGKVLNKNMIEYDELIQGGKIKFKMFSKSN